MKIIGFLLGIVAIVLGVSWLATYHLRGLFDTAFCVGEPRMQGLIASCSHPVPWGTCLIGLLTIFLGYIIWRKD